jgi:hypothetical protein
MAFVFCLWEKKILTSARLRRWESSVQGARSTADLNLIVPVGTQIVLRADIYGARAELT